MNFTLLPGRIAVLVPDPEPAGEILLPDAIRERWRTMERPPFPLLKGTVAAVGAQRGQVEMPQPGDTVWVLPKPGLIIYPGDVDIPSLGVQVPPNHTLRLYGVGDPWHDAVLITAPLTRSDYTARDDEVRIQGPLPSLRRAVG